MTSFHGRDDVLTMLIHLGYPGYDIDTGKVFIPNKEILDEFKLLPNPGNGWIPLHHLKSVRNANRWHNILDFKKNL